MSKRRTSDRAPDIEPGARGRLTCDKAMHTIRGEAMTRRVNKGVTHWDGCWESHHDCAIVMLAEARAEATLFKAGHAQLAARVERLREALEKYGRHPDGCPKGAGIGFYKPPDDARCDCGIDAALASTPAQSLEQRDAEIVERCARVADARKKAHAESANYWAEKQHGQTAGFAQIREHESRDIAAAIRALKPASDGDGA